VSTLQSNAFCTTIPPGWGNMAGKVVSQGCRFCEKAGMSEKHETIG
jgi:hypothetical protein